MTAALLDRPTARLTFEHREAVDHVIDTMTTSLAEPWPLARMARTAIQSPTNLLRLFERHTATFRPPMVGAYGMSPHLYLMFLRLERTKRLLAATDLTSERIAHAVGYRAYGTFAARFHRETGVTPIEYRHSAHRSVTS